MLKAGPGRDNVEYVSMTKMEDGVTHVYIAEGHPNPVEALLHCFLRTRGFSHAACTLAELFASQRKDARKSALPDRFVERLWRVAPRQLAKLVQRTSKKLFKLEQRVVASTRERQLRIQMTKEIHKAAKYPAGGNNFAAAAKKMGQSSTHITPVYP